MIHVISDNAVNVGQSQRRKLAGNLLRSGACVVMVQKGLQRHPRTCNPDCTFFGDSHRDTLNGLNHSHIRYYASGNYSSATTPESTFPARALVTTSSAYCHGCALARVGGWCPNSALLARDRPDAPILSGVEGLLRSAG